MTRIAPSKLDRWMAWPMFVVAMVFLLALSCVLQFTGGEQRWREGTFFCAWLMAGLYPLFVIETAAHWWFGNPRWKNHLLFCLLPPMRIASRERVAAEQVWLPWMGWRKCNDKLQDQVESHFSIPMIFVALLILPLLAIKQFWQSALASNPTLGIVADTGETFVWLAFTIEFIFMITIVRKKLGYCVQHWLDIFVICVPFLAFVRLARLGALFRLSQVSKLARAYRLRGLALRFYRGLLLLNIIERVLRLAPERRLKRLQDRLKEKEVEVADLKEQITELEEDIEIRARKKAAAKLALEQKDAEQASEQEVGEPEPHVSQQVAVDAEVGDSSETTDASPSRTA